MRACLNHPKHLLVVMHGRAHLKNDAKRWGKNRDAKELNNVWALQVVQERRFHASALHFFGNNLHREEHLRTARHVIEFERNHNPHQRMKFFKCNVNDVDGL